SLSDRDMRVLLAERSSVILPRSRFVVVPSRPSPDAGVVAIFLPSSFVGEEGLLVVTPLTAPHPAARRVDTFQAGATTFLTPPESRRPRAPAFRAIVRRAG